MARAWWLVALMAGAIGSSGCSGTPADGLLEGAPTSPPQRIVSLAPSLTETLFALGVGDRVVGVTRYCSYPPAVRDIPRVGGHLDPNIEAIVSLEPDLVIVIPSSSENRRRLESLGIRVLEVDQHDVDSVLASISTMAEACGVAERGRDLRAAIEERLTRISSRVAGEARPRAVVVVGHQIGDDAVRTVWAAGRDTFYDGVVRMAGGVNAVEAGPARYPELSREGLAAIDPDVVIDVIAGLEERHLSIDAMRAGWRRLTELRAVREDRVVLLEGDNMVVPGPRLPEMVGAIARVLHPALDWGQE